MITPDGRATTLPVGNIPRARADWRIVPTTRRTSRDVVDIVSDRDGHIASAVLRGWAERIVRAVNAEGDPRLVDADPVPGETVHALACYHRKWRLALAPTREAYHEALDAVGELLTEEQRRGAAWNALDVMFSEYLAATADHLVAALATHFPGIAPAIRAVAYHAEDDMDGTGTADCCRPPGAPIAERDA